jgi:hypothetical protein
MFALNRSQSSSRKRQQGESGKQDAQSGHLRAGEQRLSRGVEQRQLHKDERTSPNERQQ